MKLRLKISKLWVRNDRSITNLEIWGNALINKYYRATEARNYLDRFSTLGIGQNIDEIIEYRDFKYD